MRKLFLKIIPIVFVFSFCKSSDKSEDLVIEDEEKQVIVETKLNAQEVFNSMPDRKVILGLIDEDKIDYNPDLLNNPDAVSKYTLEFYKAANLGIYGSDLSIANTFNQSQESILFLKCVNNLAANIGVNNAFDQAMFDRMEANRENNDSTLDIITNAFKRADEILKNNNRPSTSTIILAGAWIEGMYVSCKMSETAKEEKIIKTIINQGEALENLIVMLDVAKLPDSTIYLLKDLKKLQLDFKEINSNSASPNLDTIKTINKQVALLRNKLISGGEA